MTRPPGYLLRVDEGELDSERLERAVESGDLGKLTDALALWRGPPLSQFAYESFAQSEIARLEELRLAAVEALVDAQLALGRHDSVIKELEPLLQQQPLRERPYGQLMLAFYRSGRQAEALDVYQRARRSLDERLGIEPGPALRELERTQDPQPRRVARGTEDRAPGRCFDSASPSHARRRGARRDRGGGRRSRLSRDA